MSEVPLRCESAMTKRAAKDVHGGLQHREVCRGDRCSAISATGRGQPGPQRTTRKLCGDHTLASPTAALPDTSTRRTPQLASFCRETPDFRGDRSIVPINWAQV